MEMCYSLKHLSQFQNKEFIREYTSPCTQRIYNYGMVIEKVAICMDAFHRIDIKKNVGIAIDVKDHSAEICILILSILNYDCHFYCIDFENTKIVPSLLESSRVEYVISKQSRRLKPICPEINEFVVMDQQYFMGKMGAVKEIDYFKKIKICYTISTSGSTGEPKMVHAPYDCIYPNIKSLSSILGINEHDVIFLRSPPTFDPFLIEFFMALEKGSTLLVANDAMNLAHNIKLLEDVTILQTTPSLFRLYGIQLIRDVIFQSKSSLRCILLGGELFPSLCEIQSWLPENFQPESKRIINIYGVTEYSCWATICEYNPSYKYEKHCIGLGEPLDDVTMLQIVDVEDDTTVFPSTGPCKGELLIGSSVRRCYIPQYDEDACAWNSGHIIYRKSGDIVERDIEGKLYYVGRVNNCIKRLGKLICLDSLANTIEKHLNTKTLCLWHEEHNKLIFCLQWDRKEIPPKPQMQRLLKEHLNDFEQPDIIKYIDELPLNKHGKVDRMQVLKNILSIGQKLRKSPLNIFQTFLDDVLDFRIDLLTKNRTENGDQRHKRIRQAMDISFTTAGGTSFQALSLATEIGELLEQSENQRQLLEMLLSSETSLQSIMEFLTNAGIIALSNERKFMDYNIFATNNAYDIKLLWRTDLKKCVDCSPSLYKNTFVSVGSHSHLMLTLDTKTGEEISRIELSDRIECSVVFVSSDLAIVGCYDGLLYGFNFKKGLILWKIQVNGMIKAKPIVMDNLVIVSSYAEDFNIRAYDLETLKCAWRLKLGTKGIFSSPLKVTDNLVLVCSLDGTYALVESANGSTKWIKKLDSPIFSSPAQLKLSKNELIIAEVKGKISVCNEDNGEEITHFQADGTIFSSITLHREKCSPNASILFGCHDGNVYCLHYESLREQISLKWKISLKAPVYSTPMLAFKDTIVACSTKGLIVLIDLSTSIPKGSFDIKADVFSTPCIDADRYIYVGSRDNFLYALEVL